MNIKYHKTCSTLPIYNFHKIIDENNLLFLVKGYSEEDEDEKPQLTEEAKLIFQNIIQEYSEITSSKEALLGVSLQIDITALVYERDLFKKVMDLFHETRDFSIISTLSELGFSIEPIENAEDLLKRLISHIKGLNNKIRIKKNNYAKRFEKNVEKIKNDLDKEALMLELNLSLGREIDVHKTSVVKWVKMIDLSRERAREYEKTVKR